MQSGNRAAYYHCSYHNIAINQKELQTPPEMPGFEDMLQNTYVKSVSQHQLPSAAVGSARSRIKTYFESILNQANQNLKKKRNMRTNVYMHT